MNNFEQLQPQNDFEKVMYDNIMFVIETLKKLPAEHRLENLKDQKPSDLSLALMLALSLINEEYEISKVVKDLLDKKGIRFDSEKFFR